MTDLTVFTVSTILAVMTLTFADFDWCISVTDVQFLSGVESRTFNLVDVVFDLQRIAVLTVLAIGGISALRRFNQVLVMVWHEVGAVGGNKQDARRTMFLYHNVRLPHGRSEIVSCLSHAYSNSPKSERRSGLCCGS